jgi:hypothetical protein
MRIIGEYVRLHGVTGISAVPHNEDQETAMLLKVTETREELY